MNITKISLLAIMLCSHVHISYIAAGEEKESDRLASKATNFRDDIITEDKDFNLLYPVLAYGFAITGNDFQKFMQERLLGKYAYELSGTDIVLYKGIEKEADNTVLGNAIQEAEIFMVNQIEFALRKGFLQAVNHNKDIDEAVENALNFVLSYKDLFGDDILELFKEKINSSNFLLRIACYNNTQILQRLIAIDINVNIYNSDGLTPLMYAAHNSHKESVAILLKAGADVNIASKEGRIALMDMIQERTLVSQKKFKTVTQKYYDDDCEDEINEDDFIEIFQMLIDAQSNVNFLDTEGSSGLLNLCRPLHYRYYSDHFINQLVLLLIQAGAQIDIQNSSGDTALIVAVENENIEIVKILLAAKAKMNIQDNHSMTALMHAVKNNNIEIIKLLIGAGVDVSFTNDNNSTVLLYMFDNNLLNDIDEDDFIEMVQTLLDAGANVTTVNIHGDSIISLIGRAVRNYPTNFYDQLVGMLMKAGLSLNSQDLAENSQVPLIAAIDADNINLARALLKAGADVNVLQHSDGETTTPLMQAATDCDLDMIDMLFFEFHANLNMLDEQGNTALMIVVSVDNMNSASVMGSEEDNANDNCFNVVKRLILFGTDIDIINIQGHNAFDLARPAMKKVIQDAIAERSISQQLSAATI